MCDLYWLNRQPPYYPIYDHPQDPSWRYNWQLQFDRELQDQQYFHSFISKDSDPDDGDGDLGLVSDDSSSNGKSTYSTSTCSTCSSSNNYIRPPPPIRSSRVTEPETSEETDDDYKTEVDEESIDSSSLTYSTDQHRPVVPYSLPVSNDLLWVNNLLKANFTNISQLGSGAAYCQLMDMLFLGCIAMSKVKFETQFDHERVENFKMVQAALRKVPVHKIIPIEHLVRGNYLENLKFLQWFRNFFELHNANIPYDALAARKYIHLGSPVPFHLEEYSSSDYGHYGQDEESSDVTVNHNQDRGQYPPQQDIVLGGSHRQCCKRGWYYKAQTD